MLTARITLGAAALSIALLAGTAACIGQTPAAEPSPAAPAPPAVLPASAAELYRRMTLANAQLRTYKAKLGVTIVLRSFLPLTTTLNGTLFFKQPDKQAVVFDSVPALAKEFQKVYPRIEAPLAWPRIYSVSSLGSEGGMTTFRLVPLKHGRVLHLDVRVDEATATIRAYAWTYEDGGDISFQQSFATQSGFQLPSGQTGRVNLPAYKADVTSTIGEYQLNVPLSEAIFEPDAK
jgi:hypothetical protein